MIATILIVDDIESNIKLLSEKLLSEYYNVLTANNGYDALDILDRCKVDIVLLDVMMPQINGFEVCKIIKADPKINHIPVIMVTALSDIENRIKGLNLGADEFLAKPINDIALFARVKSLTRMKFAIDELKLRNITKLQLGANKIDISDDFQDDNILLIDDDPTQAKNINSYLSKITNNIKIVTSCDQLSQIHSFVPQLTIISCQMQIDDPLLICVKIRSNPLLSNTSFMFLAEEENLPIVIKGLNIGVNDYCIYPIDQSEFHARVKIQLRQKKYHDNLRVELQERLDLSIKDSLTGLFNRQYFDMYIQQLFAKRETVEPTLVLLIIDIDNFKQVNDNYGHQAGDALLKQVSTIFTSIVSATDLIARYGGEEFMMLLNDGVDSAMQTASHFKDGVAQARFTAAHSPKDIHITISIGVTLLQDRDTVEQFINRADKALYQAKNNGKNQIIRIG